MGTEANAADDDAKEEKEGGFAVRAFERTLIIFRPACLRGA